MTRRLTMRGTDGVKFKAECEDCIFESEDPDRGFVDRDAWSHTDLTRGRTTHGHAVKVWQMNLMKTVRSTSEEA